jgi:2-aminoethylphosphonate transport system permease protein
MLIYSQAIQQFDYPGASVVALCNIALSLALYFVYRGLLARSSA